VIRGAEQGEVKMQTGKDDRSLGELFGDLAGQTGALVREEVTLAKAELTQTATQAGKNIAMLVIGGAVAYAGLLALLAAVILALVTVLPAWLAALIVGLVVAGVGALLLQRGRAALAHTDLAPRQTLATLVADVDAVKGERG
jgi:uncharacterized membrane protein